MQPQARTAVGTVEGVREVLIILNSKARKEKYTTHSIDILTFARTLYRDEHNGEVFVFVRLLYQIYYTKYSL
jgi:hypothetical protein